MNTLRTTGGDLVAVDCGDLLDKILAILEKPETQNPFKIHGNCDRLIIDIDSIAEAVAGLGVENPLGASERGARTATVNFTPGFKERFPNQITKIKNSLKTRLESAINQQNPQLAIEQFVANLITDLEKFKNNYANLDFSYPFGKYSGLQKQRLSITKNPSSKELLKFHKLTITVGNTSTFNTELKQGLGNYIKSQFASASESDRDELDFILQDLEEDAKSDFYRLKEFVDIETIGKLKKQAQICYLEFLQDNISTSNNPFNAEGLIYLKVLIQRLKQIDEYIVKNADGDYLVNYAGTDLNYADAFARAEAFDMLPIIPKIEGYLGETKDENKGDIQFIFGLKLKFNNPVQAYGGKTVFEYYLNLLDPESEEHKAELADPARKEIFARKLLKLVFLYYFVFAAKDPSSEGYTINSDLEYDPIPVFEEKVLKIFKGSDEVSKQKLLRGIKKGFEQYNVASKIDTLKNLLQKILKHKHSPKEFPLHISVRKNILDNSINNISTTSTFFKPELRTKPKEVLKYIAIGQAKASENSLCTLTAKIAISDVHYFASDDLQSFSMEYDVTGVKALPVLLRPTEQQCTTIYNRFYQQRKLVEFTYSLASNKWDNKKSFVYRFTFDILAYTCLKLLLEKQSRLFIPILRLQLSNQQSDSPVEEFMRSLSKRLSHLLNEEHRSNSQGIDIRNIEYKAPNVMSSLYSVLPKKFTFAKQSDSPKELDKLAIVIVSSRESDARWNSNQKLSNLQGEIVGAIRQKDGSVRLQLLKTFSETYEHEQMFKEPTVVRDEIGKVYKLGFRHFLYIAKAPYSSTLHMTQKEDALFFMSKDVIKYFKENYNDIKIYPMFFDKYYAVKLSERLGVNSLYIQDTLELTALVKDPSKRSVVFFNLFNGLVVGSEAERNYRGVISYATLLNIYQDILDDEHIHQGLISNTQLKNDILQYLTLFHFSRYEKASGKNAQISFKLDPYENLIGDQSVGKLSLYKHMGGVAEFNALAFLTKVKEVLNTPTGGTQS
ncbi:MULTISPECIES: hypothetical protein [unclassified Microcoleus]|uniref:hypothetical protein n=1 Tax=unclassified Microcoleus TaxID=2642155 RepID=UPI001D7B3378|nr:MULTISPECIES: hypothetical protein [unclassified Microcoleus]MCC3440718.1 hypothetical protein [Microcoleus sp. PH2017_03_ELD_O_A]MCC3502204.1 hypothetical protein [Microcoleus sp. PH2017_19_SFW_U_A]TAE12586.1 MAG: hypothetical protein EAZ94_12385 [Oscillatoriales cyanobacterium]MCC3436570.1 hypothetical protein [Microcoleus sp. PH2017_05_CCC_O_A]MCC3447010.1 hypothetical protein [Microcoleus sp. PH2017_09_SFU_O_A]